MNVTDVWTDRQTDIMSQHRPHYASKAIRQMRTVVSALWIVLSVCSTAYIK